MNPFPIYDGMLTGSNLVDLVQVMAAAEFITEMLISCLEHRQHDLSHREAHTSYSSQPSSTMFPGLWGRGVI